MVSSVLLVIEFYQGVLQVKKIKNPMEQFVYGDVALGLPRPRRRRPRRRPRPPLPRLPPRLSPRPPPRLPPRLLPHRLPPRLHNELLIGLSLGAFSLFFLDPS